MDSEGSDNNFTALTAQGLTDADREILRAWIAGAAFPVFEKVINDGILSLYRQLETAPSPQEMFRLQGRIQGLRYAINSVVNFSGLHTLGSTQRNKLITPDRPKPRDPRLPK